MKPTIFKTSFLLFFVSCFFSSYSQETPESADTSKVYTDLKEALKNPGTVYHLDLSKKKLKAYPVEISQLTNLRVLSLDKNRIKILPKEIGDLKNLEELYVSKNSLEELSPEIGNLANLKVLVLGRNNLVLIPPTIGKLQNLEMLDIWDNNLVPLPEEIKELKNLKTLELRGILFSNEEHLRLKSLLPNTKIMLSPSCNCKN